MGWLIYQLVCSVFQVNTFTLQTVQLLNRFAITCEQKLAEVSRYFRSHVSTTKPSVFVLSQPFHSVTS